MASPNPSSTPQTETSNSNEEETESLDSVVEAAPSDEVANQQTQAGTASSEVVFVAGGIPGETADIQIYWRKKNFVRGKVVKLLEISPDRQEAACPYFGVERWPNCGGCQWQHTSYKRQLAFKAKILRDQFERIGGMTEPPLLEPVAALSNWGYRNNVEFQVDRLTGDLCYHRQNSIRLVPVQSCHIAHPLINLAMGPLTSALKNHLIGKVHQVTVRVGPVSADVAINAAEITALTNPKTVEGVAVLERFTGESPLETALERPRSTVMFILRMLQANIDMKPFVAEMQAALDPYTEITIITEGKKRRLDVWCGPAYSVEVLNGVTYHIPPLAFFQSNAAMAQVLIKQALAAFASVGLNLKTARVLDVYCGVGTFGLQLAQLGAQVLGIEEYEGAIEAARANAKLNSLSKQTEWVAAKAEEYILQLAAAGERFDAVLVDPPRRGCDVALLNSFLETRPAYIVYVSCDPSTLARDVKILADGYELVQAQAIDLFPQTYHMETVSLLRAK
jgi:23S rRNA (uracil1939-C5)-methyltransferase